ncbi:ABC transporter permease [Spiractinospora alimapuensis]|uniref:ABC transporter permease n=1 Tax=Spiractinospora alimapuensis TaxID=2820884 RepID=UPI001F162A3A|nr:ABC transporter permease [Spiractinospora alimapuensis]QVQ52547.1 ABC transporter permease [Spiractinospora alimapuensis]
MTTLTHTRIVLARELRPVVRDPLSLVFTLVQPLVFLALFAPLLGGLPGMESSLNWFVPGVLAMIVLFGTSATGSNLLYEITTGSHERMLVTPLNRSALLLGRAVKEIVPLLAQALLIIAVSSAFGFRFSVPGGLLGLVILCVFGMGVGALSYSLALPLKDREWVFWLVQQTLMFPLLILSGMLLPLDMGPEWLRVAAQFNPLTHIVDAQRALFGGELGDAAVLNGAIAALATLVVGLWVGLRSIRNAKV